MEKKVNLLLCLLHRFRDKIRDKFKTIYDIKKFKKIVFRTFLGVLCLALLISVALALPFVQSMLAKFAVGKLNDSFGTEISVERLSVDFFGTISLKGITAVDKFGQEFIQIEKLDTRIADYKALKQGHIFLGDTFITDLFLGIHTQKQEELSNIDLLIAAFDNGEPGTGKFRMKVASINLNAGHLRISNDNNQTPLAVDFQNIHGQVKDFLIKGPDIFGSIQWVTLDDNWQLGLKNLKGEFSLTKTSLGMGAMILQTNKSTLKGDLLFSFAPGEMKYFTDKVDWDLNLEKASINTSDINVFADVFAPNKTLYVATRLKGTMNDFSLFNARLSDQNDAQVIGYFAFKNVFDPVAPFWMNSKLTRLQSNRKHLVDLMPAILTPLLPEQLDNLGHVNVSGDLQMTKKTLNSDVQVLTSIGKGHARLDIQSLDDPNLAKYKGNVVLERFNMGVFLQQANIGTTSLDLYVDGHGFNQASLNTSIKGDVFSFEFSGYRYTHIAVDGTMKMPYFSGLLFANDPNLKLDFNGKVDLSSKIKSYDFLANVHHADLYKLGLVRDKISQFQGDFYFNASGNTVDDLQGEFKVNQAQYINSKDTYNFSTFSITSSFDQDRQRSIVVASDKAISGVIEGKYTFAELPKLFTNAFGSLYTNYSAYPLSEGQFIDWDVSIDNRLIEVFLPQLALSEQTRIAGMIDSDQKKFKLSFDSPSVNYKGIDLFNIGLNLNNNNPLYNTFLSIDSVRTNSYTISDFNLLNLTHNDTLFIRSEFQGGKNNRDKYDLNLYHTINQENLSVVGFKKSQINFKDFLWFINEQQNKHNKVVFNKKLTDFSIDDFSLSHQGQRIEFNGVMRDSTYKDLDLKFVGVDLHKISPDVDNIEFAGVIDGDIHFLQEKEQFQPKAKVHIDSLYVNKVALGDLNFSVHGNQNLDKFEVLSTIEDKDGQPFLLEGDLSIVNKKTFFNLQATFDKFTLKPVGPLLSSVLSSMRGDASGKINVAGRTNSPEVNGRLYLNQSGFVSKFTGVDYSFEPNTAMDITESRFILRKAQLRDSKFSTKGIVDGFVSHKWFKDWVLDLKLSSDNLLALNTNYEEGSLYYGTAYINGQAHINGPVEMLGITITATSNKGTSIKIPLKEAQGTGENNFIHFLSPAEKRQRAMHSNLTDYFKYRGSGVELDFEFILTPDAEIEIILDRESGHAMKGRGAGFITMEINTLGKFLMWGDFNAQEGEYNFKYGGIIDKKFYVKKNGTIRWDGDPLNAILDLQAIYHTEANPSVIIDNSIINRKVPTDVAIVLNGSLSSPEVDFEINFPTVTSVVKSELDYKLLDRDTRERQAMALLATGSFLSSDNSSTALAGSLFERASSIFDDLFSDEDDKFKVGLNYAQGERNPYTQSEGRLGVTFTTKVNDRISVNGKLGVPVGGIEQSVIVGDVEVLLRINEEGTLNARFFNKENDINYIGEGIGYTQGVGITYEVDFDSFKELLHKILSSENKKQHKRKQDKDAAKQENLRTDEIPDSDFNRDFIRFYEQRKKTNTK